MKLNDFKAFDKHSKAYQSMDPLRYVDPN